MPFDPSHCDSTRSHKSLDSLDPQGADEKSQRPHPFQPGPTTFFWMPSKVQACRPFWSTPIEKVEGTHQGAVTPVIQVGAQAVRLCRLAVLESEKTGRTLLGLSVSGVTTSRSLLPKYSKPYRRVASIHTNSTPNPEQQRNSLGQERMEKPRASSASLGFGDARRKDAIIRREG